MQQQEVKLSFVGDKSSEKSNLILCCLQNNYKFDDITDILDQVTEMPNFHEDDDIESRKKDYKGTDVFIICFSLVERKSYENALNFYKELLPFSNNKPIILVGNKLDICDGLETDFAISQVRNQAKTMEFNCEVAAYEEKSRKDVASIQQLLVKAVNLHFHPTLWRDKKEFKKKEQEKTKKGEKSDEKKKCNIQ